MPRDSGGLLGLAVDVQRMLFAFAHELTAVSFEVPN